MNPHIPNPYNPNGDDRWNDNHKVVARVSQDDYFFLKKRFPMLTGLTDKVVSTIYKKLIDELRRIDSVTPIEPAWAITDPSYLVLRGVLERCSFGVSDSGGDAGAQHAERRTDGIHQTVHSAPGVSPDSQSVTEREGRVETKESKTRPRSRGPRVARKSAT